MSISNAPVLVSRVINKPSDARPRGSQSRNSWHSKQSNKQKGRTFQSGNSEVPMVPLSGCKMWQLMLGLEQHRFSMDLIGFNTDSKMSELQTCDIGRGFGSFTISTDLSSNHFRQ